VAEQGYWQVAQSILPSEPAAQLETGQLRIAQSEMGKGADRRAFRLQVNSTAAQAILQPQALGIDSWASAVDCRVQHCMALALP
jgi:hypothetical protein